MLIYEATFLRGKGSPLYNGGPRLMIFARNEHGALMTAVATRDLPDWVIDPTEPEVEETLRDMGYTRSNGASGPCLIEDGAGWRMLVQPTM
jgi:hypothetical protein